MRGQTGWWRGGDGVAAWWVAVVALQLGHLLSCARAGLLESNPGLAYNFYQSSCPNAESIIRSVTWAQVGADSVLPACLLRLHFHDCFVKVRLRLSLSLSLSSQPQSRSPAPKSRRSIFYSNISTGYPIPDGYPVGTGTGPFFYPIGLLGMDICIRIGYDIGSGIIIPEHNPTRCHPYIPTTPLPPLPLSCKVVLH
jgi:hypothetical protein